MRLRIGMVGTLSWLAAMGASGACGGMEDGSNAELAPARPDTSASAPALAVGWTLEPDPLAGCDAIGGVTARVISTNATGQTFVDLFECEAGAGVTDPLPIGRYAVRVEILDVGGALLARSSPQAVDLERSGVLEPLDFRFPVDGGFFAATWTVSGSRGRRYLACREVGAERVSVLATRAGTDEGYDFLFECGSGAGFTGKLPLGAYTIVVSLLGPDDQVIASSPPLEARLAFGNQLMDLGNFDFAAI